MPRNPNKPQYEVACSECGTVFVSHRLDRCCCSPECSAIRKKKVSYLYYLEHKDKYKRKGKEPKPSERRLDLEKDKRDGQQGYIMSEKDEQKKAARKKVTPMDEWAEAKRNGCTLSYGKWQAQRYIEEMRRGES